MLPTVANYMDSPNSPFWEKLSNFLLDIAVLNLKNYRNEPMTQEQLHQIKIVNALIDSYNRLLRESDLTSLTIDELKSKLDEQSHDSSFSPTSPDAAFTFDDDDDAFEQMDKNISNFTGRPSNMNNDDEYDDINVNTDDLWGNKEEPDVPPLEEEHIEKPNHQNPIEEDDNNDSDNSEDTNKTEAYDKLVSKMMTNALEQLRHIQQNKQIGSISDLDSVDDSTSDNGFSETDSFDTEDDGETSDDESTQEPQIPTYKIAEMYRDALKNKQSESYNCAMYA
jgi:hypothetical protein